MGGGSRGGDATLNKSQSMANPTLFGVLLGHECWGGWGTAHVAAISGSVLGPQTCPESLEEEEACASPLQRKGQQLAFLGGGECEGYREECGPLSGGKAACQTSQMHIHNHAR